MGTLIDNLSNFSYTEKVLFGLYIIYIIAFIVLIALTSTGFINSWYWLLLPIILTIVTILADLAIRGESYSTTTKSI